MTIYKTVEQISVFVPDAVSTIPGYEDQKGGILPLPEGTELDIDLGSTVEVEQLEYTGYSAILIRNTGDQLSGARVIPNMTDVSTGRLVEVE